MRGELSTISELQRGVHVKRRKCIKLTKKQQLKKENILSVKEKIKQKMKLKAQGSGGKKKDQSSIDKI